MWGHLPLAGEAVVRPPAATAAAISVKFAPAVADHFAATTNPWMIASISDDCAAAWSARLVMVS